MISKIYKNFNECISIHSHLEFPIKIYVLKIIDKKCSPRGFIFIIMVGPRIPAQKLTGVVHFEEFKNNNAIH